MANRRWGKLIKAHMERNDLWRALQNRQAFVEYVYAMFELVLPERSKDMPIEKICDIIEGIKKKE